MPVGEVILIIVIGLPVEIQSGRQRRARIVVDRQIAADIGLIPTVFPHAGPGVAIAGDVGIDARPVAVPRCRCAAAGPHHLPPTRTRDGIARAGIGGDAVGDRLAPDPALRRHRPRQLGLGGKPPGDLRILEADRRRADVDPNTRTVIGCRDGDARRMLGIGLDQCGGQLGDDPLRLGRRVATEACERRSGRPTGVDHNRAGRNRDAPSRHARRQGRRSRQFAQFAEPRFAGPLAVAELQVGARPGVAARPRDLVPQPRQGGIAAALAGRRSGVIGRAWRRRRRISGRISGRDGERHRCGPRAIARHGDLPAVERERIGGGDRRLRCWAEGVGRSNPGRKRPGGKGIAPAASPAAHCPDPHPRRIGRLGLPQIALGGPPITARLLHLAGGGIDFVIRRIQCQRPIGRRSRESMIAGRTGTADQPDQRALVPRLCAQHHLIGLRRLRRHVPRLVEPGQRPQHVGVVGCRAPRLLQEIERSRVLSRQTQAIGLCGGHDPLEPRDGGKSVRRPDSSRAGALDGLRDGVVTSGPRENPHDRLILARIRRCCGQRPLGQRHRACRITQFLDTPRDRRQRSGVQRRGRANLTKRRDRLACPPLPRDRLRAGDRRIDHDLRLEPPDRRRLLRIAQSGEKRGRLHLPAAGIVQHRRRIQRVGRADRLDRLDQRLGRRCAALPQHVPRIFVADPGVGRIEQQSALEQLIGLHRIAVARGLQCVGAQHPALQLRLASPRRPCLPREIGGVGVSPLPLVDVGQQRERGPAILGIAACQRFGQGLRAGHVARRQLRPRIVEAGIEPRRAQRLRPARAVAASRRALQQVDRGGEPRLAQPDQAEATGRIGIAARGGQRRLERAFRMGQIALLQIAIPSGTGIAAPIARGDRHAT